MNFRVTVKDESNGKVLIDETVVALIGGMNLGNDKGEKEILISSCKSLDLAATGMATVSAACKAISSLPSPVRAATVRAINNMIETEDWSEEKWRKDNECV